MFLLYATSAMYTSLYLLWALFNTWRDPYRKKPLFNAFFDFKNQMIVCYPWSDIDTSNVFLCLTFSRAALIYSYV